MWPSFHGVKWEGEKFKMNLGGVFSVAGLECGGKPAWRVEVHAQPFCQFHIFNRAAKIRLHSFVRA